jgi:Fe-S oxidoreductase
MDHGTMCQSYMVTLEERHSTRGRAHLLFEMIRGGVWGRWRNESVHEAQELCLSCKGCKSDCPVNVDMATYKAEFLAHYYQGRLRPRAAYVFGLIHRWARLGSWMPALANVMTHAPGLSRVAKWAGNIEPRREIPRLASKPFLRQWRSRSHASGVDTDRKRVILWPDTFNNHFQPDVLSSAASVLEDAGFRVEVPRQWLCCGRPLYDYGMLDLARKLLREIVDALSPDVDAGVHIVGVEPSCIAVFRDELVNLLPDDERAARVAQSTLMLDEFLAAEASDWTPPHVGGTAIVQGHCHQKAVLTLDKELSLLGRAGLDVKELDAGCCGMAGGFGYETSHYDVSVACGERKLLPAVREAASDTVIVADGFSCREQIRQETGREAVHFAQVIARARTGNGHVSARAR